ncbi:hypothetical protein GGS26DRAFT_485846 [Hypomontagnella submonticulosa]|nr:hypothetical protein GGS26DRAFT_485846 [Hypomontagnella submonticulosa]
MNFLLTLPTTTCSISRCSMFPHRAPGVNAKTLGECNHLIDESTTSHSPTLLDRQSSVDAQRNACLCNHPQLYDVSGSRPHFFVLCQLSPSVARGSLPLANRYRPRPAIKALAHQLQMPYLPRPVLSYNRSSSSMHQAQVDHSWDTIPRLP